MRYQIFPIIFSILFVGFLTAHAQEKFGSAYYVNDKNDTIRGLIKYEDRYLQKITFKENLKANAQTLGPETVKSFTFVKGNTYEYVNFDKDDRRNQVYAKKLVGGAISLYDAQSYFLMGSDEKSYFLINKGKTSDSNEAVRIYQKNVGAFNFLFNDCPAVVEKAKRSIPSQEGFMELVTDYHNCKSLSYKNYLAPNHRRIRFGVFAGISQSQLSLSGELQHLNATSFSKSINPTAGILMLITPSRKQSSILSMQLELLYSSMQVEGSSFSDNSGGGYNITVSSSTTVESKIVMPRFGLRFTGRSNVLNPYFCIGIAASIASTESHNTLTVIINDGSETTESDPIDIGSSSLWGGVGLKKPLKNGHGIFLDMMYDYMSASGDGNVSMLSSRLGFIF